MDGIAGLDGLPPHPPPYLHDPLTLCRPPVPPQGVNAPEELVEIAVLHVLEHHDEGVPVHTHAVELDDVLVLQVGEQLGLPLEVLPGRQGGILQGLGGHGQRACERRFGNMDTALSFGSWVDLLPSPCWK